uniref:Uncharacterized protein n=1 Tax=Branchiostoma floridae TaxID=7739 RepID=C3XY65_BRAFL|eukprot:XP_002611109.1 hypothetical protein BRAFLDRAFT_70467 [Branchiostoma floridae]
MAVTVLVFLFVCLLGSCADSPHPCTCDFETDLCQYTQDTTDDFDWRRNSGRTPTGGTGPTGDHTTGSACPTSCIGTLRVSVKAGGTTTEIWSRSGNQGNQWFSVAVSIPVTGSYQVIFEGVRGQNAHSDIAIDDVSITQGACPDVDECVPRGGRGPCDQVCANTYGGFVCSCNAGFTLHQDGRTCNEVRCPTLTAPENGAVNGGNSYQDVVQFTCNHGYQLIGDSSRTCQADGTWTGADPACIGVQCPTLTAPENGAVNGGNSYQDVVQFTCNHGYQLIGDSSRTCQADGTWTGADPTCIVSDLTAYTYYDFWIVASIGDLQSDRSDVVKHRTMAGVPKVPRNVRLTNLSWSELRVTWDEPDNFYGPKRGYVINLYTSTDSGVVVDGIDVGQDHTQYRFSGLEAATSYTVEVHVQGHYYSGEDRERQKGEYVMKSTKSTSIRLLKSTKTEILDLLPNSVYTITVTGFTYTGEGNFSRAVNCTVPPGKPSKPEPPVLPGKPKADSTTFPLQVKPASERNGPIGCYHVVVVKSSSTYNLPEPEMLQPYRKLEDAEGSGDNIITYIAMALTPDAVGESTTVTVGDGIVTSCNPQHGGRKRRALTSADVYNQTYTNSPLEPGSFYTTSVRAYGPDDGEQPYFSASQYMEPVSTGMIGLGVVSALLLVALVASIAVNIVQRRRLVTLKSNREANGTTVRNDAFDDTYYTDTVTNRPNNDGTYCDVIDDDITKRRGPANGRSQDGEYNTPGVGATVVPTRLRKTKERHAGSVMLTKTHHHLLLKHGNIGAIITGLMKELHVPVGPDMLEMGRKMGMGVQELHVPVGLDIWEMDEQIGMGVQMPTDVHRTPVSPKLLVLTSQPRIQELHVPVKGDMREMVVKVDPDVQVQELHVPVGLDMWGMDGMTEVGVQMQTVVHRTHVLTWPVAPTSPPRVQELCVLVGLDMKEMDSKMAMDAQITRQFVYVNVTENTDETDGGVVSIRKGSKARSSIVNNLIPYTNYTFWVVATINEFRSNRSEPVTQRTLEGVPTVPQNVQLVNVSWHELRVAWEDPERFYGPNAGYFINLYSSGEGSNEVTSVGPVNSTECYHVIVIKTDKNSTEGIPEPEALQVYKTQGEAEKSDLGYAAYIAMARTSEQMKTSSDVTLGDGSVTSCKGNRTSRDLSADDVYDEDYVNSPLTPDSFYATSVRAYGPKGDGQPSFSASQYTTPTKTAPPPTNPFLIPIIAAVCGVALLAIIITTIICCLRRRERSRKPLDNPQYVNGGQVNDVMAMADLQNDGNDDDELAIGDPVPADHLEEIFNDRHANDDQIFREEYGSITDETSNPHEEYQRPENYEKNRFKNIFTYDHSRVVLSTIEGEPGSDYINANYVDGYNHSKKFIAAQGPLETTVDDFWRMTWEQDTATIVMVTKLVEKNKRKCAQYWPIRDSSTYGTILVTLEETTTLVDYVIRTFTVKQTTGNSPARTVTHFHFTSWPDHGVPQSPLGMMKFIRRAKTSNPRGRGPIIVHCSAGVGRTGTFIAIEAMQEMMAAEGRVDVHGFIGQMRHNRHSMVQTEDQYVFIYRALLEQHLYGDTEVEVANIHRHMHKLKAPSADPNEMGYEAEFKGYRQKDGFLATQGPLPNTVDDFWRLVWEWKSYSIVMLTRLTENGKDQCHQYWPDGRAEYGKINVELKETEKCPSFILRTFHVGHTENTGPPFRVIRQFHFRDWPCNGVPENGGKVLDLIGKVEKQQQQSGNGPITVHCSSGAGRTGAFIALNTVLERVKAEGICDLFQTVKSMRYSRPHMVQTAKYPSCL